MSPRVQAFLSGAGVVWTNAHVLGSWAPKAGPPTKIDAVVHSGEPDETVMRGNVIGVDRETDLASFGSKAIQGKLAAPLPVASPRQVSELQKAYIFGFPLGGVAGKNITVGESSVSLAAQMSAG